jgi:ribosomal subunit interface protein
MDITIKGRHTEVSDRFRAHTLEKLSKLDRYDHNGGRLDVEVSEEHNPRQSDMCTRVELTFHAKGPVFRAQAAAQDCYAALDVAITRLQTQLAKSADRRRVHHGGKSPISVAAATAAASSGAVTDPAETAEPAG